MLNVVPDGSSGNHLALKGLAEKLTEKYSMSSWEMTFLLFRKLI
jgi:hypothetical protein